MPDEQQEEQVDVAALMARVKEYEAKDAARALEDKRKEVIAKYELPANLHGLVKGATEEEFDDAAKALKEAFAAQQPAAQPDPAYAAYGPASGTQGAPVSRSQGDERAELIRPILGKIKNDIPLTRQESQTLVKIGGNHAMSTLLKARRAGQGRP